MEASNEVFNPVKWRARISKNNIIVLKFFVENNRTLDINLPMQKLKQIIQIFREIIGRPAGKEIKTMDWDDVVFQFGKKNSKIKLLTNKEKSKVCFGIETINGIKAEVEISSEELKNLINLGQEQLSKLK
tara:strand:- start:305 stop:694 length:390 start_codon:yes stop_codon:yes gene_type:complete